MLNKVWGNIVFKNFSYLTIGTVISQLISLVTILKITSILEPEDYGLFTFLIAQGMLLLKIGDLGNRNIIIRTIARNPEQTNDLVVNGAIMRCIAVVSLFLIYIVYNFYFGNLDSTNLLLVFAFSLINCFVDLFEIVFHGNQQMFPSSIINLSYSIIWFVIIFFLIEEEIAVSIIFFLYILTSVLKLSLYFLFLKRYKLLIGKVDNFFTSSKKLISESWPYFVMILIMLPLTSLSNNFLDINSTKDQIGYFNLSDRLIGPISLVIGMALSAIFPNLSSLWAKNKTKFHRFMSLGFGLYMLVGMTICFMFTLFSEDIVILLFPESYLPAVAITQIQVWYLFLTSVDSLIGVALGAANKEKTILRFGVVYFLVCTPSLFYGSKFGALGLSISYVLSYGACLFYVWPKFKKVLGVKVKHDWGLWILAPLLFAFSYYTSINVSLTYKFIIAVAVSLGVGTYLFKVYRPMVQS